MYWEQENMRSMERLLQKVDAYMMRYPESQNPLSYIQILGSEDKIVEILSMACGRKINFICGRGVNELLWFYEEPN